MTTCSAALTSGVSWMMLAPLTTWCASPNTLRIPRHDSLHAHRDAVGLAAGSLRVCTEESGSRTQPRRRCLRDFHMLTMMVTCSCGRLVHTHSHAFLRAQYGSRRVKRLFLLSQRAQHRVFACQIAQVQLVLISYGRLACMVQRAMIVQATSHSCKAL